MNSLPTLIEYLLLTHDYVVVPGMGTFIAQQTAAHRNDEEEAFLPPVRSLRFNAGLNHEDNLLPDSIKSIYNTTPEQAEQMLTVWVSEFAQALEDEQELEFGTLGIFTRERNGSLVFTSHESGIASPDFYGLDAFHMSEVQPERRAKIVPMTATMETSEKEITIRINRRIANIFVAACAAILLFLVFNSPIPGSAGIEQRSSVRELLMGKFDSEAHSLPVEAPKTESPKTKTIVKHITVYKMPEVKKPEQPAAESAAPEVVANEPVSIEPSVAPKAPAQKAPAQKAPVAEVTAKVEKTTPVVSEPVQQNPQYCIVMASAISRKNAENYAAKLREQGFNNPRVHASNKMVRVVVGNYSSESEAYNVAETMRRSSDEYGSVWVLKL